MRRELLILLSCLLHGIAIAQIGINTSSPNPKSALDIVSSNKGVLLPRLTSAERDNIPGLGVTETGLTIFNTNTIMLQHMEWLIMV